MIFMIEKKVEIPENIDVDVKGRIVTVKGPKGELSRNFNDPRYNKLVTIEKNDGIVIKASSDNRKVAALVGTIVATVRNMIRGVTEGYKYTMRIHYTHFPISLATKDNEVQIKNFLGEKGVRKADIVGKTDVKIDKDHIILTGIDVGEVGQTAANIEQACRLSKRDKRIFLDGIYISGKRVKNE